MCSFKSSILKELKSIIQGNNFAVLIWSCLEVMFWFLSERKRRAYKMQINWRWWRKGHVFPNKLTSKTWEGRALARSSHCSLPFWVEMGWFQVLAAVSPPARGAGGPAPCCLTSVGCTSGVWSPGGTGFHETGSLARGERAGPQHVEPCCSFLSKL